MSLGEMGRRLTKQTPICPRRFSIISKRTDAPCFKACLRRPQRCPLCFHQPASPSPHPRRTPQLNPFLELSVWPRGEEKDDCIQRHHSASSLSQCDVTLRPRCSKRLKKQRPLKSAGSHACAFCRGVPMASPSFALSPPNLRLLGRISDVWVLPTDPGVPLCFPRPQGTQRKSPLEERSLTDVRLVP